MWRTSVSRRLIATSVSALLLVGLPAAAIAQDEATDPAPMWDTSVKQHAMDVAAYGDGFVLVGGADKKPKARIWLSADGTGWSKVKDSDVFDKVSLKRVTASDDGIVALGTQGRKLVALRSADGETWRKSTVDKAAKEMTMYPDAIVDGPAGLVAVASMIGQDLAGQQFYTSSDGRSWQQIDPPSDTAVGMFVSLEATDDEYYAVSRPMFVPTDELLYRSADAVTWELIESPADGDVYDLAIGADGSFVGVGQDTETFLPAIWRADEPGTWERVYSVTTGKETSERLQTVSVGGPGFLAGGITSSCPNQPSRYCPSAAILASADGVEWQALGVEDGVPGPLHDTAPRSIAGNADKTVMVAWHDDNRPVEAWMLPSAE